jgi:hypothetical protein
MTTEPTNMFSWQVKTLITEAKALDTRKNLRERRHEKPQLV